MAAVKKATAAKAISLGVEARDRITGIQGIVTSKHNTLGGMLQWGIELKVKKTGEEQAAKSFDAIRLVYIGVGVTKELAPIEQAPDFALGDEVEDLTSGLKGVITKMHVFISGCLYLSVVPKAKDGKIDEKSLLGPQSQFKKISDGISPVEKKVREQSPLGRGGPVMEVPSH
jgi:hypothetical protein